MAVKPVSLAARLWLLPVALCSTLPVVLFGRMGSLPLLFPVWVLTVYGFFRAGRGLPVAWVVVAQLLFGAVALAMFFGPWQVNPTLNRAGHALAALTVALVVCVECGRSGSFALTCLCGVSVAVTFGVGMEIAEALFSTRGVVTAARWYDTIADLSADLSGAVFGAALWALLCLAVREYRSLLLFGQHLRLLHPED